MKQFWFLPFFLFHSVYASNYPVFLGDETVIIHQEFNGQGKTFVHVHQNETTALEAARKVVAEQGGRILTLVHSGQRNIVFHLNHHRYEFDPNRIFTDVGIQKTLKQFGHYSKEAHYEVKHLAKEIVKRLPDKRIIAVHNNQSYSLKDYLPGNSSASDAEQLNYCDKQHYRNFYLVTQPHDFVRLRQLNFNGVLQSQKPVNDGSLSVFLANRDYINVEAGYDQLIAQINMLKHA